MVLNLYLDNSDRAEGGTLYCNGADICNIYCFDDRLNCTAEWDLFDCDNSTKSKCNIMRYDADSINCGLMPTNMPTAIPTGIPTKEPTLAFTDGACVVMPEKILIDTKLLAMIVNMAHMVSNCGVLDTILDTFWIPS